MWIRVQWALLVRRINKMKEGFKIKIPKPSGEDIFLMAVVGAILFGYFGWLHKFDTELTERFERAAFKRALSRAYDYQRYKTSDVEVFGTHRYFSNEIKVTVVWDSNGEPCLEEFNMRKELNR